MLFQTYGDRRNPAVLFFHAMGVTGASSEPIARYLQDRYFCILPTSTVYCEGQKYVSKPDEIRQVEDFLHRQGVERLAMVVNLGCGLDSTGRSCDNGSCKIYNLDFPDVIAVRNELLPAGEREENIPCDLNNTEWFAKIDASGGAVFFASGVFYYFLTEQVKALVQQMADAFPGSVLVFDAANRTAVKMIAKTWLKSAKIQDVGAYFAVSDAPQEISAWDSRLQVTSRGYMLGYTDLKDPSVSGFFRFLARVGDGMMKMQIVKINF